MNILSQIDQKFPVVNEGKLFATKATVYDNRGIVLKKVDLTSEDFGIITVGTHLTPLLIKGTHDDKPAYLVLDEGGEMNIYYDNKDKYCDVIIVGSVVNKHINGKSITVTMTGSLLE